MKKNILSSACLEKQGEAFMLEIMHGRFWAATYNLILSVHAGLKVSSQLKKALKALNNILFT
jgi:hypothetical protein